MLAHLPPDLSGKLLVIPAVMFNADGLTLDGSTRDALTSAIASRGAEVLVSGGLPTELLESLESYLL